MKQLLIILMVAVILVSGCIKIGGSKAQTGKAGEQSGVQSQPDTTGLAQNPGGLQSLPDGQSGSLGGFNEPSGSLTIPGGTPSSPNMAEFPLSGQGGNQSSGMGELQGLQAEGKGGGQGGDLPVIQSGGSTGTMSGFKAPPSASLSMPAGVPVEKLPFFEKNLYADTVLIDVREPVFLGWKVVRADSYSLDLGGGKIVTVPKERTGYFVVTEIPGNYTYTLTATNAYGSVSQKVDIMALSAGQRQAFTKSDRCRTFLVYPQQIKSGESVYVYWNVLDAQNVFIQNDFTGNLSDKPDIRDIVQPYGMEQYCPYQNTDFKLTHGSGSYSLSTYGTNVCYVDVQ